ncbi:MAG TPA: TonB-dependent receptor [Vicinamibacteria bacterium]|nr:TonB-dependent receptor [Vicinamibacteria bacterium]
MSWPVLGSPRPRAPLFTALALVACRVLAADEPSALPVRVVDAISRAPIAGAAIAVAGRDGSWLTDAGGLAGLASAGMSPLDVVVTAAGYAALRTSVQVTVDRSVVELGLDPEALRRSEEVAVSAHTDGEAPAPGARVLAGAELAALANVLADDPLRAVQSLPGVTAADDFGATFAVRGLGFANVGLYVDGVLMSAPFHTVRDVNDGFSLTLLNSNVVQSLSLISAGAPAAYGDRAGSVLSAGTREGSPERFVGHASLALTGLQATVEGPLGRRKKTTWLASARKSYVDYVLERLDRNSSLLGFYDATARLTHHATSRQAFSLGWLHGRSSWRNAEQDLRPQDARTADAGTDLGTLQWRWDPSSRTELRTLAFFSSETGRNRNADGTDRMRSLRRQWGARSDAARTLGSHRLEAGLAYRRLEGDVLVREFLRRPAGGYRIVSSQDASDHETNAYVQDTWTGLDERLTLAAGARLDVFGATDEARALPRGSVAWEVSSGLRVQAAFGRYAQFPDLEHLYGRGGNPDLRSERATHAVVGLEKRLGAHASLRVEAYHLDVDGLFFNPEAEWRLVGDEVAGPDPDAPLRNGLAGRSRGVEVVLQRRSASGPSGWIAYTFGHARWSDEAGQRFDGDFDQRHTVTFFARWRLGSTFNVSTKLRHGSGFPVAGYYEAGPGDDVFLSSRRNAYRPGGYSRWDVRADKAFLFQRFKLTLYGEVVNVLDVTNRRYTGLDELDVRSRRVGLESDTLFPMLPTVGMAVDF